MNTTTLLFLALLGLSMGSFINALTWRIHETRTLKSSKKRAKLSILRGRSMCPHCNHTLTAGDLIPVISWLMLSGRCRYCKKPISIQYPLVELATAAIFVGSAIFWPFGFTFMGIISFSLWLVIATILNALFVYDLKWMILPNRLVYPLIGISLLAASLFNYLQDGGIAGFAYTLLTAVAAFMLFYAIYTYSKGSWIGGGDVKLIPALALLVGTPINALMVLFVASFIGSAIGIPMMLRAKSTKSVRIPFGPLLIAAAYIVFFFGEAIVDWYTIRFLTI